MLLSRREGSIMKSELMDYKLQNLRKRRLWSTMALRITRPFEVFVHLIFGSEQRMTPSAATKWERYSATKTHLNEESNCHSSSEQAGPGGDGEPQVSCWTATLTVD